LSGLTLAEDEPGSSSRKIHESLGNRDRVAYLRKKFLNDSNNLLVTKSGHLLAFLTELQKRFGDVIVSSSLSISDLHISFQDEFMRSRLLDVDEVFGRKIGGLLTDTTYKFFREGDFKIC
jgi:hypothetical protein